MLSFTKPLSATAATAVALLFTSASAIHLQCNSTRDNPLVWPLNPATTQHDELPFSFFIIDGQWCNYATGKTCGDWTAESPAQLSPWPYGGGVDPSPLCNGSTLYVPHSSIVGIQLTLANGTEYECIGGTNEDDVACDA